MVLDKQAWITCLKAGHICFHSDGIGGVRAYKYDVRTNDYMDVLMGINFLESDFKEGDIYASTFQEANRLLKQRICK